MRGMKGIGIMMMMGVFAIAIALLAGTEEKQAYAQEATTTTTTLPEVYKITSANTEERCKGKTCIASVSAAPQFVKNSQNQWMNITDYVNLSLTSNGLNISWENNYATLEPMVNYSGKVYTWNQIPLAFRSFVAKKYDITKGRGSYKFAFNISGIPNLVKNNVNGIGFQIIANSSPMSLDGTSLVSGNVAVDFSDILDGTYTLSIPNSTTVWITNVSGLNAIYIDPTITTLFATHGSASFYMSQADNTTSPAVCSGYDSLDLSSLGLKQVGSTDVGNINASDVNSVNFGHGVNGDCSAFLSNFSLLPTVNWAALKLDNTGGTQACTNNVSVTVWNGTSSSWRVLEGPTLSVNASHDYNITSTDHFVNNRIYFLHVCDDFDFANERVDMIQLEYQYTPNVAPVIQAFSVGMEDWAGTSDIRIGVNYTDADGQGDLSQCWINNTAIRNTTRTDTNMCWLDVANTPLDTTFVIWLNDTANATDQENITIQLSNVSQNFTAAFAHTLATQVIELNNTINGSSTRNGFNFTINYTVPFPSVANLSPVNISGTVIPTTNRSAFANWSSDWLTNSGLQNETFFENRSRAQTLGSQWVTNQTNISVTNHANATISNINVSSLCTSNGTLMASIGSYSNNVYGNCSLLEFNLDNLGEVEGTQRIFQNRSNPTHNQTVQNYINETYLNVTNAWGIQFLNASFTSICEGSANNATNGTVPAAGGQVNVNCSWNIGSADIVNESRNRYNVTGADIVMDRIESGYAEIRVQVLNISGFAFDIANLTVNSTPLLPGGWENATGITENYTLDMNLTQINLRNVTINRTSPILINVTLPSGTCPAGATVYGSYCYNTSTTVISSVNFTIYTVLTQFNVTDSITATFPLVTAFDQAFYPSFATRATDQSVITEINSSGTNTSFSTNSTHLLVHVGTGYGSSSLSATGTYTARVVYLVSGGGGSPPPGGDGGTGGGGGGGGGLPFVPQIPIPEAVQEVIRQLPVQAQITTGQLAKSPVAISGLVIIGGSLFAFGVAAKYSKPKRRRFRNVE